MPTPAISGALNVSAASLVGTEIVGIGTAGPQVAQTTVDAIAARAALVLTPAKYSTGALESAAIPAANLVGADSVIYDNTGTTPGNLQFPTAAALVAALPAALRVAGYSYNLGIRNSSGSANTATITTNTGITLTGTMTIAQSTTRNFVVTLTSTSAVTVQSVGLSAAGA